MPTMKLYYTVQCKIERDSKCGRSDLKMSGKNVIITGATGMVGGHALEMCLEDQQVAMVTVIGRRSVGFEHPKLVEVLHHDLADFSGVESAFENQDVVLFCLGVYSGAVPDDEFRRITVDLTAAFSRTLHAASPKAAFCFLSGGGADSTESSRVAFARYKGIAENALLRQGLGRVHIFRAGYIYPVDPREEPNLMYRISRNLYPILRRVYPNIGISSEALARAMVDVGLRGAGDHTTPILENRDIRSMEDR